MRGFKNKMSRSAESQFDLCYGKTIFWDYDGTLRRRVKVGTLDESKPTVDPYYIEEEVEREQRPRVSELITIFEKRGFVNLITSSNLKERVISELKEQAREYDAVGTFDYNIANNYKNPFRIFRPAGGLVGLFPEENIFCRGQLGLHKDYGRVTSKIWRYSPYDDERARKLMRKNCLVIGDHPGDIDTEFGMVFLNVGRGRKDPKQYQGRFHQDASAIGIIIEELLLAGEGDFAQGFDLLHSRSADHDIGRVRFSMERHQEINCIVERGIHSFYSHYQGLESFPMEQIIFSRIFG